MRHPDSTRRPWREWRARRARCLLGFAALLAGVACRDGDAVRVRLLALPAGMDPSRMKLHAQIAGPLDSLQYHWFAVSGIADPQVTSTPAAGFTFAEGTSRDRVTVEVWRSGRAVATAEADVELDAGRMRVAPADSTALRIDVTLVPPYDAGGPDTRADIAGSVTGAVDTASRIVLYARASDVWYVQPMAGARHVVRPDGSWRSWTHTGTSYAALLVRPGALLLPIYDVLPQVGPQVAARAIVDGTREEPPAAQR